ncbi:gatB domain protein [Mycobacterium xenopi 3993]|nr:gatB domain protein [Mycobacterium xenopi 3993]
MMRDLVNAGAVDLVIATVEHGAPSEAARAWWGNFLVQKANEAGVELDELPITPEQVAAVIALVDQGKLSNKLARQVVEGVLAGEGEPEQVMNARGLAVVRDDSLIQAAVDEALAANPDIVEKIRGGKVQAAGAIVGAVMRPPRARPTPRGCANLCFLPAGGLGHTDHTGIGSPARTPEWVVRLGTDCRSVCAFLCWQVCLHSLGR